MSLSNLLLSLSTVIPFDKIDAASIEAGLSSAIKQAGKDIAKIKEDKEPRTFANTIQALEDALEVLEYASSIAAHLESVKSTPDIRASYNKMQPELSQFFSTLAMDEDLYHLTVALMESSEVYRLSPAQKRLVEKMASDFERNGAKLGETQKLELSEIDRELCELTLQFSQNVLDATSSYELFFESREALKGLPDSAIEAARLLAETKPHKGHYKLTLQAPSLTPAMTYLDDSELRKKLYLASHTRALTEPYNNKGLISKILNLRSKKATLLGFENFADYILADRMAKKGEVAKRFVSELREKAYPAFLKENEELQAFRDALEGEHSKKLEPWDIAYYAEKQRKALYEFDEEELRPYFSHEGVLNGLFILAERLYGLRVKKRSDVPVWHESVEVYGIYMDSGSPFALIYTDWFPRGEKRDGAWMQGLIDHLGSSEVSPHQLSVGVIAGNLTPPQSHKPALLNLREVETIFHEFGHLLHHILSEVEFRSLAGTRVAWDFVELPSQIMENWIWHREALDLFARHYETGEPIPQQLFDQMQRSKNFRAANHLMRQLGFSTVDLALHTEWVFEKDPDVFLFAREKMQKFSPALLPDSYSMIASFTHLFGGSVAYASAYYSYQWAEALDADAFSLFEENGIFDRETGERFKNDILSKGNVDDPSVLYRRFRGRDVDLTALLKRSGLAA